MRNRISNRLIHFIQVLGTNLPDTFGLVLKGSWAKDEYHAVEENTGIFSYSDVDFVCNGTFTPSKKLALQSKLFEAAASCNLRIQDISVRPAQEMQNMWTLENYGSNHRKGRDVKSDFIQFWTLLGAAEVCAALALDDGTVVKKQYHINKFLLAIWRDLAIVSGSQPDSHAETLSFASQWLSPKICAASYGLKLGIGMTLPWETVECGHRVAVLNQLKLFIQNAEEFERIEYVISELVRLNGDSFPLSAVELLKGAKVYEHGLFPRKSARQRVFDKLIRRTQ